MKELNEVEQMNYDEFYGNVENLQLSASAIKMLLDSPKTYFEHYVLGNKQTLTGKHFDMGSLIHCMILEPEELPNKFVKMGVATPSDSIKACIDHLLTLERSASELEEYAEEIIEYLKEINLYQSLVDDKKPNKDGLMLTGDQKRLAKVINENSKEYFEILIQGRDKTIVDPATWETCLEKVEAILANDKAFSLLRTNGDNEEIAYELEVNYKPDGFKFTLKGILDAIKIDHVSKTVYISDVKTTNGKLKDFKASAEKFNYWLQEAIYVILGSSFLEKAQGYKIEFNFIVVDNANDVYCFKVTPETSALFHKQLKEIVNTQIDYHISKNDFTLPYEFANNLVCL